MTQKIIYENSYSKAYVQDMGDTLHIVQEIKEPEFQQLSTVSLFPEDAQKLAENLGVLTPNKYQEMAGVTSNKSLDLTGQLLNGALGLTGEAGEVADMVKKHIMQGHSLDTEKIAGELGDVLWYVAEAATAIGHTLEDIMLLNIAKLAKRYPEGFSTEASLQRVDTKEV